MIATCGSGRARADKQWQAIDIPSGFGLDCGAYKWRQDQSRVEVFIPLPEGLAARQVRVAMEPTSLKVTAGDKVVLSGPLAAAVKAEESTWLIRDHILEISLLKRPRRGHYDDRHTNFNTFWRSVLTAAPAAEVLQLAAPPAGYYDSEWENDDDVPSANALVKTSNRPMIDRSKEQNW